MEAERVRDRIRASGLPYAVTIVSLIEQMRGRLAYCSRASLPRQFVYAAELLHETFDDICGRDVLDFDDRAAVVFAELKAGKIRISTPDLRIAAIVLANDATLITRNLSDFRKVPKLRAEDWTRTP